MPIDLNAFRTFVLQKYPNISKSQLSQLDDFISKKQEEEYYTQAAQKGLLTPEQAISARVPLSLIQKEEPKPSTEQQKRIDARKELLNAAEAAKDFFEKNKDKNITGFALGGRTRRLRETLGLLNKEQIQANTLMAQVNQMLAFSASEGGGKQFTETERLLLSGLILDPQENENVIRTKLDEMIKGIKMKQEVGINQLENKQNRFKIEAIE